MWQLLERSRALWTSLAVAGLCACAGNSTHQASQQARDRYLAYAGAPLQQFTWLGRFYSWEGLSRDQLVVFTTANDAYLLKVWSSCDLRFVIGVVGISSTGGTVRARLDAITLNSSSTGRMVCPIEEIRSIDYRRMRADIRAAAQTPGATAAPPQR